MKIVLAAKSVYPFHPFGGVQKYVYNFAKHLVKKGLEVEIVAPCDDKPPRIEVFDGLSYTFLRPSIYKYLEYPIGWLGMYLFSLSLAQYLKKKDFDVLHAFDLTGVFYLRQKFRKPVVAHVFSDNYLVNPISLSNPLNVKEFSGGKYESIKEAKVRIAPSSDGSLKRKYFLQYMLKIKPLDFVLRRADRTFMEEEVFLREIEHLFSVDPKRMALVPVGVELESVDNFLSDPKINRAALGFQEDDVVLITVNRLAADKGVDKIVLALAEAVKKNQKIKLVIIGKGYQEEEILRLIHINGLGDHVRHLRDVPEAELYSYYRISDIYISAFSYPGSSISSLEAMACSKPLITTAQPWLVDQGLNGVFLEKNDPAAICAAVIKLIEEGDLKGKGELSRKIAEKYSWTKIVNRAFEAYLNLMVK